MIQTGGRSTGRFLQARKNMLLEVNIGRINNSPIMRMFKINRPVAELPVKAVDIAEKMEENNRPMSILQMAGINHRTAPLQLREKLAIPAEQAVRLMAALRKKCLLDEVVILSTCNRTEFYWSSATYIDPQKLFKAISALDAKTFDKLIPCIYAYGGKDAARHLFEVASGLDSLALGETQIYHQVKTAYEQSHAEGFTAGALNLLFQKTFKTTKRVHNETGLASQKASVPSVALEFAKEVVGELEKAFVLVVGTGEIAQVTLEALRQRGVNQIAFVTRSAERAQEWQAIRRDSEVTTLDNIGKLLWKADIVIACTTAKEPVITTQEVKRALNFRGDKRPLLILDLGLPRNVAPGVARLENVYLKDIDDLQQVVESNKVKLEAEVAKARKVINEGVDDYVLSCRSAIVSPTIKAIREHSQRLVAKEVERSMRKLSHLSPEDQEEVKKLAHRIQGKLLHTPSERLRNVSGYGNPQLVILLARLLFGLEPASPDGQNGQDAEPKD
jgi:glutamyl-tRNA reductase